jgi:hypothetical protein
MAMGGVKKDICKFNPTRIAKKYGSIPYNFNKGKKIGTKIINISVHSKGNPSKKIIICVKIKNSHGSKPRPAKNSSKTL